MYYSRDYQLKERLNSLIFQVVCLRIPSLAAIFFCRPRLPTWDTVTYLVTTWVTKLPTHRSRTAIKPWGPQDPLPVRVRLRQDTNWGLTTWRSSRSTAWSSRHTTARGRGPGTKRSSLQLPKTVSQPFSRRCTAGLAIFYWDCNYFGPGKSVQIFTATALFISVWTLQHGKTQKADAIARNIIGGNTFLWVWGT